MKSAQKPMNKPYQGRANIEDTPNNLRIEIPAKKNWFIIVVFAAWLICWLLGEIYVLGIATGIIQQELEAGLNGFFIFFWLLAWSLGGIYFIRIWLYMTFGREVLTLSEGKLRLDKKFALFQKTQVYQLAQIKNFSVNPNYRKDPLAIRQLQTWTLGAEGAMKFDYGPQTVFLGGDIHIDEANYLIHLMKEKPVW